MTQPNLERSGERRPPSSTPASIGPWRILEPLGRGGMGVVYRARHGETGLLAALKTVSVPDESMLSSIRREIHALRGVDHPGVVRVLDEGVEGGLPWYAMELLEGRTLRDHNQQRWRSVTTVDGEPTASVSKIAVVETEVAPSTRSARSALPRPFQRAAGGALERSLTVMRALCSPLAFIHGRGIVHRDLKPENVFVRDDGTPVLVDFGLAFQFGGAKGRDVLEASGRPMGSPSYMAPEQIRGDLVDARADLYALGCMLYEAVTGTVPFVGGDSSIILSMHLYTEPLAPSALVEGVPPALDALLLRLLQKRPEDRIGYADDVAAELARLGAAEIVFPGAPTAQPYLYRPGLAGRGEALSMLCERLDVAVKDRRGSLVFLGGESGVGKTRLAMEAAVEATRAQMTVVTGACVAVSAGDGGEGPKASPLHPFRELLLAVADRGQDLGPDGYDALLGPRGRVLAPYEPALAQLRGHERYPEPADLPPDAASFRLRSALAETLAAFAAEQPVLLVIDDLQWADENSRAFLEHLGPTWFEQNPVVILGTYRSEEMTPALEALVSAPGASRIELGRLDGRAVGRMVSDMLAMEQPPEGFTAFLLQQSEGNPFFIAEYLRAAIQEGLVYRDAAGAWRLSPGADGAPTTRRPESSAEPLSRLPLPGSLRALVARRLSGLGPAARAAAQMASVLGRELEERVLVAAAGLPDVEALEALAELGARQVLEETAPGRLRFVHDKLREVAYAEIPDGDRNALHGAAARAIEARYAGAPDAALAYPLLAHHFAMAGVADKTLEYLEKAGAQALATGASGEALGFFRGALELDAAQPPARRADALRRARWERNLGQAHYNLGDLRGAERHNVAALELLTPRAARIFDTTRAATLAGRARPLSASLWQLGTQMAHLAGLRLPLARTRADRERFSEASLAAEKLSETYLFQNEPTRAFLAALTATNAAARLGPSPALARGYATLSVAFGYVPWPAVVGAYAVRAEATAAALGDIQAIAFVAFLRGLTALGEGRTAEATARLEQAEHLAEALSDRRRQEECMALLGSAAHFAGRWPEAMARYAALLASAERSDNAQGRMWARSGRAQCLIALGDAEEAAELLEEDAAPIHESGDRAQQITHGQVALAHLLRGDRAAARRAADRTLALVRRGQPAAYHCIQGYSAACEVYLTLWEDAQAHHGRPARDDIPRRALEAVRAMRRYARIFPLGIPSMRMFQGLADWLEGRRARAQRTWTRAIAEAERLELPAEQGRAHWELARHLDRGDPERARHTARAIAIFEALDMRYWRERVERG